MERDSTMSPDQNKKSFHQIPQARLSGTEESEKNSAGEPTRKALDNVDLAIFSDINKEELNRRNQEDSVEIDSIKAQQVNIVEDHSAEVRIS